MNSTLVNENRRGSGASGPSGVQGQSPWPFLSGGGVVSFAQKLEELHTLAQAALHHLRRGDHFPNDRRDLRRAEVEFFVEDFDVVEDFGVAQVGVVQGGYLDAVVVDQFGVVGV